MLGFPLTVRFCLDRVWSILQSLANASLAHFNLGARSRSNIFAKFVTEFLDPLVGFPKTVREWVPF